MKKTIVFALSILVASCSMKDAGSLEEKKAKLTEKEKELAELETEINTLKEEISELDTAGAKNNAIITKVEVAELKKGQFNHFVELTGTVTSKQNIMISAEAGGRVLSVPAKEGQKVSKDQVLVRLENEAVANQLSEAQAAYDLADATYKKRKNLWDQNIGSEIEYLQAKTNYESTRSRLAQVRTQYDNTIIKSPIRGSVDDIQVNEGEFVNMGMPVVRVVDLENVEIEADLSEEYLTAVHKGDTVTVKIPALGISMRTPISFVSQVINPNNRSFKVKVNLDNRKGIIKPNVLANIQIRDYKSEDALIVPSNIITKDLKGDFVFVVEKNGDATTAVKKYITKGRASGAETEILSGLEDGDKIITAGYNQVNNGEAVSLK